MAANMDLDIDPEVAERLRGDAIGDTMYSQRFVLKTLLKFDNITWDKDFEDDLCFLWDMTADGQVCKYLFDNSFPSIACDSLSKFTEPRFVEIIVGILANIHCPPEILFTDEQMEVIIAQINSNDPLTLIQVMRFIDATFSKAELAKGEKGFLINELTANKMLFILNNSTNCELLKLTLKTVSNLLAHFQLKSELVTGKFLGAAITAFEEINGPYAESMANSVFHLALGICLYYIEEEPPNQQRITAEINEQIDQFHDFVTKILDFFIDDEELLLNQLDDLKHYMELVEYFYATLQVEFVESVVLKLIQIGTLMCDSSLDLSSFLDPLFYFLKHPSCQNHMDFLKFHNDFLKKMCDETKDKALVTNLKDVISL